MRHLRAGGPSRATLDFARTELRLGFALAFGASLAFPDSALAQAAMPSVPTTFPISTIAYRIPPGPLGPALHRLAAASGAFIVADGALTQGRSTAGLTGLYDIKTALALLLHDTGIQAVRQGNSSWLLQPAPTLPNASIETVTLPTVRVTAHRENASDDIRILDTSIAGGMPRPAGELPQSISIITQRQIEAQSLTDLQQALEQSTGVTTRHVDNSRYRVYARGFQLDALQIDGVATSIGYLTPPDLAIYEQVEVASGPAGLATGFASPGGTVNLVRKRPTDVFKASVSMGHGLRLPHRVVADLGGPIGGSGAVRSRIVAVSEERDGIQRGTSRHETQLYGVIEADVATGMLLRLGGNRHHLASKSMQYGYPTYRDGRFLAVPWSTYYGADWNSENYSLESAFTDLTFNLPGAWQGRLAAVAMNSHRSSAFAGLSGAVEPGGTRSSYRTSRTVLDDGQWVLDARAQGPVNIAERTHQLLLGAYAQNQRAPQTTSRGQPRRIDVDLAQPQRIAPVQFPASDMTAYDRYTRQLGAYGSAEWSLTDHWSLITGTRVLSWRSVTVVDPERNAAGMVGGSDRIDARMTSSAAVTRSLGDGGLAYASLAQAFTPQSVRGADGRLLPPLRAIQREIGLKDSVFDGEIAASAAWFEIDQRNRAVIVDSDDAGAIYAAQGRTRSRGLMLQINGRAGPDLNLSAGYTLTLTRALGASAVTGPQATTAHTPRHLLKVWGDYRLAQAWRVGGALQATSDYTSHDGAIRIRQPGFAVASAWVECAWTKNMSLKFHIGNLFNRRYYASLGTTKDHNFPGELRSATLTVQIQY